MNFTVYFFDDRTSEHSNEAFRASSVMAARHAALQYLRTRALKLRILDIKVTA